MSKEQQSANIVVRSVLMPLQGATLLLPNAAVSEVVSLQTEERFGHEGAQGWLRGTQVWRQQIVPLVAFEKLLQMPFDDSGQDMMVAVCNTLNGNPRRPYVGILMSDIPHLFRAHMDMIETITEGPDGDGVIKAKVKVGGEELTIPDLDGLETRINAMLD